jgi:AraC-like DNA-binding protein
VDVLSDVLAAMRTGRPHSSRPVRHAPWRLRAQPFAGAGFHVVLEGGCWFTPPGGQPIALGVGDLAFLPHGSAHELSSAPGDPSPGTELRLDAAAPAGDQGAGARTVLLCGAYLMDRSRPHPLLADLPEVIHLPARLGAQPALRAAIDLLATELADPRPGADAVVPALLDTLLAYLLRTWYERHAGTGWAGALADPAVAAALRAIHGEPAHPWTVGELAGRAGLSRAAFARRFAALVGQPPLTYLTWWRMTVAARLLRDPTASLAAVARRAGYTSEFAFGKAFKRAYGVAPGRYRRAA